jgi:uncharacterized protein (TIGR02757 family)
LTRALGPELDRLRAGFDFAAHRATDPVDFVHRYEGADDREVAGLVAALLAFGNVKAIRRSVARVLAILDPSPATKLASMRRVTLERGLDGFVHRVWRGEHVARLLWNARGLRAREGSLGAAFEARLAEHEDLRDALAAFADALRGPRPDRSMAHLVPDPRAGSACKRLLLYLRWMVRPADGVDLGVWTGVDPAVLVIPVDTHVHRIGRNLDLTRRDAASWTTAEEITDALRALDPKDPVKYDFALCHLGVSRQCPSRRDPERCARCELRAACRHWR